MTAEEYASLRQIGYTDEEIRGKAIYDFTADKQIELTRYEDDLVKKYKYRAGLLGEDERNPYLPPENIFQENPEDQSSFKQGIMDAAVNLANMGKGIGRLSDDIYKEASQQKGLVDNLMDGKFDPSSIINDANKVGAGALNLGTTAIGALASGLGDLMGWNLKEANQWKEKSEAYQQKKITQNQSPQRRAETEAINKQMQEAMQSGNIVDILAAGGKLGLDQIEQVIRGEQDLSYFLGTLLSPENFIPGVGGGLAKANSFVGKVGKGVLFGSASGAITNAPVEGFAKYGEGSTGQEALNAGIAGAGGGAFVGGALGGGGAALTGAFGGKTPNQAQIPQPDAQGLGDALGQGISQEQLAQMAQSQQANPETLPLDQFIKESQEFSTLKQELAPNELKQEADIINDAQQSYLNDARADIELDAFTKQAFEQLSTIEKEVDSIQNAIREAAKAGMTPQVQSSPALQQWTQIINGGSVLDPRYDGWGIVQVVENEIQAQMQGLSKQEPKQIYRKLKQQGINDNLIHLALQSIAAKDIAPLQNHIQSVVSNNLREQIKQGVIQAIQQDRLSGLWKEQPIDLRNNQTKLNEAQQNLINTLNAVNEAKRKEARANRINKILEKKARKENRSIDSVKVEGQRVTAENGDIFYNEAGRAEKVIRNYVVSDDLADIKNIPMSYRVVSAKDLKPNFSAGDGTQFRYQDNSVMIDRVAKNFDPTLHFNQGGFDGIPIVDYKDRIIAGNHRSQGLKNLDQINREIYEEAAKANFGENVFDGVNYDDPVIIRRLIDTDDNLIHKMSAYSNKGRLIGLGERMKAAWGQYAHAMPNLYNIDGKMRKIESEEELMGLLGAKTPDEASSALMVELNQDLVSALEEFTKSTKRENIGRFDQVIIQSAYQFWNLKRLEQEYSDPQRVAGLFEEYNEGQKVETDLAPFFARAIRKMGKTAESSRAATEEIIDRWYADTIGRQLLPGVADIDKAVIPTEDFVGDLLGSAFNHMMSLKDGGYKEIPSQLKLLEENAEAVIKATSFETMDRFATLKLLLEKNNILKKDSIAESRFNEIATHLRQEIKNADNGNLAPRRLENPDEGLSQPMEGRIDIARDLAGFRIVDTRGGGSIEYLVSQDGSLNVATPEGESGGTSDRGVTTALPMPKGNMEANRGSERLYEDGRLGSSLGVQSIRRLPDHMPRVWSDTDPSTIPSDNGNLNDTFASDFEARNHTADYATGKQDSRHANTTNQSEPDLTTAEYANATTAERIADADTRAADQLIADSTGAIASDLDDIKAQLPSLFPAQQKDIQIAETTFKENKGMLFTNGTGTGKTYTGMGIAKRFYNQGKSEILIVTPNDGVINNWLSAADSLQLPIKKLENTKTEPSGVTITTYANFQANEALKSKTYDLVIYDESHKLLENKNGTPSGITLAHEQITYNNYFKDIKEDTPENEIQARYDKYNEGKVVFLSATPFSSPKSLRYANGLLFERQNMDDLLTREFGYRIRYGKLTMPEAKVDEGALQRAFANNLMREQKQSGRKIENGKDYSRQFMRVKGGDIDRIEGGLEYIQNNKLYDLYHIYRKTLLSYHNVNRILESVKAKEIIPSIKEAISANKKVVIFHSYNNGGVSRHPFEILPEDTRQLDARSERKVQEQFNHFKSAYPQAFGAFNFPDPLSTLKKEFGDLISFYNGTINQKDRAKILEDFNNDEGLSKIIVVQNDAGSAGLSLHDTTGKHQRMMFKLNLPVRPITEIQSEGRIFRLGQKTNSSFVYPITGASIERMAFSNKINERIGAVENLAMGDGARNLKEVFKDGYLQGLGEWLDYKKITDRGGVENDKFADVSSPFDMAVNHYYSRQKGRNNDKGKDFFATPEPLGFKMAEWADVSRGDKVLEPSAGDGSIARYFSDEADLTAIEPSRILRDELMVYMPENKIKSSSFEDHNIVNKYDAVVMNPPFGRAGKLAVEHTEKALRHLRPEGRLITILPDNKAVKEFIDNLPEEYSIVAEINLPSVTFNRVGTSAKTRLYLIDRSVQRENPIVKDFSHLTNESDLFNEIRDLDMPKRVLDWEDTGAMC